MSDNQVNSCKTYIRVIQDDESLVAETEKRIKGFTHEYERGDCYFTVGLNTQYDIDVNVMIRRTIKDFIDREEELKELKDELGLYIALEIAPQIAADGEEPRQLLSLDTDIIAFLFKTEMYIDLDYYII